MRWQEPSTAVLAGVLATAVLPISDRAMRAVVGREPVFAPPKLARAAARRGAGVRLSRREAARLGWVMRAGYTPALGLALGLLLRASRGRHLLAALVLTGGIVAGERIGLPAFGLTPPWRRWTPLERRLLPLHALAFSLVASGLDARWSSQAPNGA